MRFGHVHEDTLARGVGVSRKSKLIRIKGLAGRCCYGGCCRPTEEEETRGVSSGEEEPRRERNGGNPSQREKQQDVGGKGAEGTTVTTASTLIGRVKFVARWLAGWLLPPPLPQLLLLLLLLYTHVVSLSSPRAHHYPSLSPQPFL